MRVEQDQEEYFEAYHTIRYLKLPRLILGPEIGQKTGIKKEEKNQRQRQDRCVCVVSSNRTISYRYKSVCFYFMMAP